MDEEEFERLEDGVSAQSGLEAVLQAFIGHWFTKAQLHKLCEDAGEDVKGRKESFISKVMGIYSPEELVQASLVIQKLDWSGKLILSILLSGPKTKREILEHELIQRVLSRGVPGAALGAITSKTLTQKEARRYLSRKVSNLKRKHLLLMEKKGKRWIYSIHPWFFPYFKEKLPLPSEEEIMGQIQEEARRTMQFFLKQFSPPTFWPTWKDSLQKFEGVISELAEKVEREEGELRFGLPAVAASSIADQYYCEKKMEMTQRYGREKTPEMRLGREAHEKLLEGTVKAKREDVWRRIACGLPVGVREMHLLGKYRDTIIGGVTDAVYFHEGAPVLLLEHKFTRHKYPFSTYHVQASVYCFLLHILGFDTERLKYALILAPPECRGRREIREIVKTILTHPEKDMIEEEVNGMTVRVYVANFEIDRTREDLEWALAFWKKAREAISTRKAGKCVACEFKQTCPDSLARATA